MNDGQMVASDDVFYAGIFPVDAQGNVGATPVDIVKLNNNASVTVEVPLGGTDGTQPVTYAVRETNEQGVPVSQDSSFLYEVTGEGKCEPVSGSNHRRSEHHQYPERGRRVLSGTIHPGAERPGYR